MTEKAARECGLLPGTPGGSRSTGRGLRNPGSRRGSSGRDPGAGGQAGGMSICIDEYKADPRLIFKLSRGGRPVDPAGRHRGRRRCDALDGAAVWEIMKEAEKKSWARALLHSLMRSQKRWLPAATEWYFCRICPVSAPRSGIRMQKVCSTDWDFSKTKGHFIRAAMEGVALSLKHNLDVAKEARAEVSVLRAMGGSANSLLWTQIKADVTGKKIIVPSSDTATTLGAVILAGVGIGMYKSFEEAVEKTVEIKRTHEPDPKNREVYDRNYETYLKLYDHLKDIMAERSR